jgi:hypothetical protein
VQLQLSSKPDDLSLFLSFLVKGQMRFLSMLQSKFALVGSPSSTWQKDTGVGERIFGGMRLWREFVVVAEQKKVVNDTRKF